MSGELATTLVWETLDGPPSAIAPRWNERRAAVVTTAGVVDAALFRVIEGVGTFVAVYGLAGEPDAARLHALADVEWYDDDAARAGPVRVFHQVFASSDARPFEAVEDRVFAVNADIDPPEPDEFEQWYNQTHVPDVGGAGLLRARRFHAAEKSWKYFATYELASHDVMESSALKHVRGFHQYTPFVQDIQRTVMEIHRPH
jgi:hypothetical protein